MESEKTSKSAKGEAATTAQRQFTAERHSGAHGLKRFGAIWFSRGTAEELTIGKKQWRRESERDAQERDRGDNQERRSLKEKTPLTVSRIDDQEKPSSWERSMVSLFAQGVIAIAFVLPLSAGAAIRLLVCKDKASFGESRGAIWFSRGTAEELTMGKKQWRRESERDAQERDRGDNKERRSLKEKTPLTVSRIDDQEKPSSWERSMVSLFAQGVIAIAFVLPLSAGAAIRLLASAREARERKQWVWWRELSPARPRRLLVEATVAGAGIDGGEPAERVRDLGSLESVCVGGVSLRESVGSAWVRNGREGVKPLGDSRFGYALHSPFTHTLCAYHEWGPIPGSERNLELEELCSGVTLGYLESEEVKQLKAEVEKLRVRNARLENELQKARNDFVDMRNDNEEKSRAYENIVKSQKAERDYTFRVKQDLAAASKDLSTRVNEKNVALEEGRQWKQLYEEAKRDKREALKRLREAQVQVQESGHQMKEMATSFQAELNQERWKLAEAEGEYRAMLKQMEDYIEEKEERWRSMEFEERHQALIKRMKEHIAEQETTVKHWKESFSQLAALANGAIEDIPRMVLEAEASTHFYSLPVEIGLFINHCKRLIDEMKSLITRARNGCI
ncbi:hypothetical protein LR48_Vigan09g087800 [Vigna angularis]|uniref:Uncharacterized protein n=1 Tax=Phaseolus angularis TaxID=3914 RepID=A0A0L9VC28_PHAAN|nr:hypothetical protein LR48_Vigan09g087800 [Vigna angularis]